MKYSFNINNHVNSFFNVTLEQSFIPIITVPARIINLAISSVSLIDHIYLNSQTIKQDCGILTGKVYCDILDHLPTFIKIKTIQTLFNKHKRPLIIVYGPKSMDKFNTLLNSTSWDDFYSTPDPDQALTIFVIQNIQ